MGYEELAFPTYTQSFHLPRAGAENKQTEISLCLREVITLLVVQILMVKVLGMVECYMNAIQ